MWVKDEEDTVMFVCEKDMHCVDCPKNYPDEVCDHWIEVEPILHAYWINKEFVHGNVWGECSHCGVEQLADNYCGNCGAKMDGEINYG